MWDFDYVLSSLFETLPFMGLMLLLIVIPFYLLAYLKDADESLKKKSKKELNKDE